MRGKTPRAYITGGTSPQNASSIDLTPTGIDLHSGRACDVELVYRNRILDVTIRDVAEPTKVFRRRFTVDIPAQVRDTTAFVGFTGGTGGMGAVQDILTWTWTTGD